MCVCVCENNEENQHSSQVLITVCIAYIVQFVPELFVLKIFFGVDLFSVANHADFPYVCSFCCRRTAAV